MTPITPDTAIAPNVPKAAIVPNVPKAAIVPKTAIAVSLLVHLLVLLWLGFAMQRDRQTTQSHPASTIRMVNLVIGSEQSSGPLSSGDIPNEPEASPVVEEALVGGNPKSGGNPQPREPASSVPSVEVVTAKANQARSKPEPAKPATPIVKTVVKPKRVEPEPAQKSALTNSAANVDEPAAQSSRPTTLATSAPASRPAGDSATQDLSSNEASIQESDYRAALRAAIADGLHFPKRAKRRKLQGIAVVAFTVHPDGLLTDIRLSSSTGFDLLDSAALNTLETLQRFKPFPIQMAANPIQLEVPLQYSLQ